MNKQLLLFLCLFLSILIQGKAQNNALSFDGTNDYVAVPIVANNLSSFTIEAWINPATIPASGNIAIFNTNSWDGTNGCSVHFQFESGYVVLSVYSLSTDWPRMKTKLTANSWQHIAVTYDKSNSKVCFYLNGILDNSVTKTLPYAKLSAAEIGAWNTSRYFNGKLDEVRIWNVVRSANEILGSMCTSIANPKTNTGLIAYYPFNQGTAKGNNTDITTLTDASASGFNGTLTNFDLGTSNWGERSTGNNFLAFDGTDDYVDMGTSEAIDYSGGFSFTGLVKWDKFNNWSRIIDFGNGTGSDNILIANNSTQSTITFSIRKGSAETIITSGKVLNANQWYFLAFTVSATGVVSLYFDGVLDKSVSGFYLPNTMVRSKQYLGKSNWATDSYFNGSIDNISIWNKALTQSEITAGAAGFAGNESGLVHYYTFNQGVAGGDNSAITSLSDAVSTNPKDGTLTNFRLKPCTVSNFVEGISFLPPVIDSFTPTTGPIGTTVTITGTGFNTTTANNSVYFGSIKAAINSATTNTLTVIVPPGSDNKNITVTNINTGLTAYSQKPFATTFSCGGAITSKTFTKDTLTRITSLNPSAGDFDGDGKADLVFVNTDYNSVSVLRNTSTSGKISFAPKVDFVTGNFPPKLAIGDIDGDGKLDITVVSSSDYTFSVMRNMSTQGAILFAPKIDFVTGRGPISISIGDLNGDGKPDIAVSNNTNNSISIFLNISTPGMVSFKEKIDLETPTNPSYVSIRDIDGDKKPDLTYITYYNNDNSYISVVRNISTDDAVAFAPPVIYSVGSFIYSFSTGDLDGDDKPELAFPSPTSNIISIIRNTSTPGIVSFASKVEYATGNYPNDISINDLDGDAKPELVVVNSNDNSFSIMRNKCTEGTIKFAPMVDYDTGTWQFSTVIADFDLDGRPDIATNNFGIAFRNLGSVPSINTINAGVWSDSTLSVTPVDSINGFVPTGTTYSWSAPTVTGSITGGIAGSGVNISGKLTNPASTAQTATYTVTPGCSGLPFLMNVTVALPQSVSTQATTNIGFITATGNGNITKLGSPNPTQYGVVWSTSINPTVDLPTKTAQGAASSTGAFTSAITGLIPNTTYYVRAYATNAGGTIYGNKVSFKTLVATPPTVTTQSASNILVYSATGNGNITSFGDVKPYQYGMVWSTTPNPTIALSSKTEMGVPGTTGAFTSSLTGLASKTTYYARAYAITVGDTVYGNEVTFTTCDESNTVTNGEDSGIGSLRNVINSVGEGDTIIFANDMTIGLKTQLLLGSKSLTIDSRDKKVTINGNGVCRVFFITGISNKTYNLNGLNISNGSITGMFDYGGGIYSIMNSSALNVKNCTFNGNSSTRGGAVYAKNGSNFTNCAFTENYASVWGGGVLTSGGCTFEKCSFTKNSSALGGGIFADSSGTFTDCSIVGNTANRGGGICASVGGVFSNCTILNNSTSSDIGGGAYAAFGGTFINCTFTGNTSPSGGGGAYVTSGYSFTNCSFSKNTASYGGGLTANNNGTVTNCSFSGNSANYGGGAYVDNGGTFTNCIFWNSTSSEIYIYRTNMSFNYCAIRGGYSGIGSGTGISSLTSTPFISDTDLRLNKTSGGGLLCIDAGQNSANNTAIDILGKARISNGTIDMGAYEWSVTVTNNLQIDQSLSSGVTKCFNAYDTITVAGTSVVTFASGSSTELIAGKSIRFLPGFYSQNGSYMYAHITSNNTFCEGTSGSILAEQPIEKSLIEQQIIDDKSIVAGEISMKVYPNPNNGQFTIELTNVESGATVSIYNMLGSVVYNSVAVNVTTQKVNLSGIQKGIYMVKVVAHDKQLSKKIIVN